MRSTFPICLPTACMLSLGLLTLALPGRGHATEITLLSEANWSAWAPEGKEVDAIYGDFVIRNPQLTAVVAAADPSRHANLTIRHVGGCLLDLTSTRDSNDQLGAFFPTSGRRLTFERIVVDGTPTSWDSGKVLQGDTIELVFRATALPDAPPVPETFVIYRLANTDNALEVVTQFRNTLAEPWTAVLEDSLRVDGEFQFGANDNEQFFWARDHFWQQAYAVAPASNQIKLQLLPASVRNNRPVLRYTTDRNPLQLAPGESWEFSRRLYVGAHDAQVRAALLRDQGTTLYRVELAANDPQGPVAGADWEIAQDTQAIAVGKLSSEGTCPLELPQGIYQFKVQHHARGTVSAELALDGDAAETTTLAVELPPAAFITATITDDRGGPIPCKVEFVGRDGTPDPNFGPDSAVTGVRNLVYTPDGTFRIPIAPGNYEAVISHGPEFDAVVTKFTAAAAETFSLSAEMIRTVDTSGWVSAELHSHSSPSGDNTSCQRGRVLNLLAEHLEFAPCTEHARITTYDPHLEFFAATHLMATCPGMELTGALLPVNHQNAFPLVHRPRTQNGGGPETDADPEIQIERLAMWDDASDKLVQTNHPNIPQILGDRDINGEPDRGFHRMLSYMDVIEVHPPSDIFSPPPTRLPTAGQGSGPAIFHWLQLLNLGYRVPGVVNTDAHWNFHGSGWLRNYIRSATDDPAEIDVSEMVQHAEEGRIVMTNGPWLEFTASAAGEEPAELAEVGDVVALPGGKIRLHLRVQCANWLDINRVQVFVNGRPHADANFTRRAHPDLFADGVVKFAHSFELTLAEDAHILVATAGEGLKLGRVVGPDQGDTMPVAVTNPIFVDVDGNGFRANGDELDLPLPRTNSTPHEHHHEHDHNH
jgi:hypothetical protein